MERFFKPQRTQRFFLIFVSLWLFFALPDRIQAQQRTVRFEHLSIEQGLSQNTVTSLLQDRQGFMWFGTQDGLNKYDGYSFTVYRNELKVPGSLSNNYIYSLHEDKAGILWVGTNGGGLNRFDSKSQTFTVYRNDPNNPKSISSNVVNTIYEDRTGRLWIGTDGGGLNRFDPQSQSFTIYRNDPKNPNSISSNVVWAIYEDRNGALWVGTDGGGLNRFDLQNQSFTVYRNNPKSPNSISSNVVNAIYEDREGRLWIGTDGGLNRFDRLDQSFTVFRNDPKSPNSISNNVVNSIYEDRAGILWIGTNSGGLNRFDPQSESFTAFRNDPNNSNSISSNVVNNIYEDRSGILWMGTDGGGLNRFDPNGRNFTIYGNDPKNPKSISSNLVYAIHEDGEGRLWIGTQDGLNRLDPKSGNLTVYRKDPKIPNSISSSTVYVVCEDRAGTLWIGTFDGGLNRFDPEKQSFTVYRNDPKVLNSISSNLIWTIYEDRKGSLWIGTLDGLNRFDPQSQSFTVYRNDPNNPNSISSNLVYAIYEDGEGRLWIGTQDGINRFDPQSQSFTVYRNDPNNPNSISSNVINSIHEDRAGTLWIGTNGGGLNRFDFASQTFISFTEKDGLSSDSVFGVLEDKDGNLWLSTNRGLSKFNPQTKKFRNYYVTEGLHSNEFNSLACYKSRSGEIFFGGINGFIRFYPEQVKENTFIPPIVITAFNISDQPVSRDILSLVQNLLPTENRTLEISYKESFAFEFSALNFISPEKNRYAYKLEGFDKDWIYCDTKRYARYANLDPGEYLFIVKGSNNDDVWNEAGTAVRLRVVPPLWRTWWAYLLYFAGLASTGYGGYRYRLKIVERKLKIEKAAELEAKNQELSRKNQELIESHKRADRIFSALSDALPGTILDGKYRLDEKIGSGGFGAVYRGTHLGIKRPIAVKVFKPTPGNDSAEGLERFLSEAVSAGRINHPNAVVVLDSGISSEGIAYLVMELLEGHTLTEELRQKGVLSLGRAAQILYPVSSVLHKAHAAGIIHRDIKPDNIFLHQSAEGEVVKVVDFGIAKLMESDGSIDINSLTATGKIVGTPVYMSPERLEGKPYDGRSDVYSLGIVLYEMLCGRVPFYSSRDIFATIHMHLNREPQSLKAINPSVSDPIEALVLQSLSKDPQKRPSAKDLGEEFLTALGIKPDILASSILESIGSAPQELTNPRYLQEAPTLPPLKKTGLTVERIDRIEELLNLILQQEPDKWKTILDEVCTGDTLLRKTIETILFNVGNHEGPLTPERWRQVEDLFYRAIELTPEKRSAFLDENCLEDTALRRNVEALIDADEEITTKAQRA